MYTFSYNINYILHQLFRMNPLKYWKNSISWNFNWNVKTKLKEINFAKLDSTVDSIINEIKKQQTYYIGKQILFFRSKICLFWLNFLLFMSTFYNFRAQSWCTFTFFGWRKKCWKTIVAKFVFSQNTDERLKAQRLFCYSTELWHAIVGECSCYSPFFAETIDHINGCSLQQQDEHIRFIRFAFRHAYTQTNDKSASAFAYAYERAHLRTRYRRIVRHGQQPRHLIAPPMGVWMPAASASAPSRTGGDMASERLQTNRWQRQSKHAIMANVIMKMELFTLFLINIDITHIIQYVCQRIHLNRRRARPPTCLIYSVVCCNFLVCLYVFGI